MKTRSYYLECALILVFLYFGLKAIDYHNAISGATESEKYSAAFGLTLLLPHYLLIFLGAIFNIVAILGQHRWAVLTAAILYTVGGVLGLGRFLFMIIPMVLCYIEYGVSKHHD